MKKIVAISLIWQTVQLVSLDARAQVGVGSTHKQTTSSLSMGDLLERLKKHPDLKQQQLQTEVRREELRQARLGRIPVFYLDANLQRNLIIPSTPVPAIAFDPNAAPGEILPLKFATKWSSKAGIQLDWKLFDPARQGNEIDKGLQVRKGQLQEKDIWKRIKHDAVLAYTSVVLASKQLAAAQQDSTLRAEILQQSKTRFEAGREPSGTYRRAEQEFERSKIRLREAWSVLQEADLEISKFLGDLDVKYLSNDITAIQKYLEQQGPNEDQTIPMLEVDQKIAELDIRNTRRSLLPSLTLSGYLGEQYYGNEIRLDQGDRWYGHSYLSLGLRVPLSEMLISTATLRKANLNRQLIEEKLIQAKRDEEVARQQTLLRIAKTKYKVEGLQHIQRSARDGVTQAEAGFREGRLLWSELNEALLALQQVQTEIWQAEFDLIKELLEL